MDYDKLMDFIQALPPEKQQEIEKIIMKMVMEWDADYCKLTPKEEIEIDEIIAENEYIPASKIDWDALEKYI